MSDKYFLDTNVFVYTFDLQETKKAKRAESLIAEALRTGLGVISYQVVQEFVEGGTKEVSNGSDWPPD